MRFFHQICRGLDVVPVLNALVRQPDLWNVNNLRTTHEDSPHTEVEDIWLRFNDLKDGTKQDIMDNHESINYPAMTKLGIVRPIIFNLMRVVEGERLGRVIITRLAPGKSISKHVDSGDHAAYYDRYHVVLQSLPGTSFRAGNEEVNMQTGDIWWFDNGQEHEVVNNSADDRLTMIVDIRTTR